jgi:glycosyltransferase involved in cell wall biosynthesis
MMTLLAGGLAAAGERVDLVVPAVDSIPAEGLPPGVRVVALPLEPLARARWRLLAADPDSILRMLRPLVLAKRTYGSFRAVRSLAGYLTAERPAAILAPTPEIIFTVHFARRLARSDVPVVASFRSHLTAGLASKQRSTGRWMLPMLRHVLRDAARVHAVSRSVRDDLAATLGLDPGRIEVFHSPTLRADVAALAAAPVDHPWLADRDRPVVVTVGRVSTQKDYPTLLAAFAQARRQRPLRLIAIGEVTDDTTKAAFRLAKLRARAADLGIADDVDFVGYRANPFAWMARADVFLLTSRFEGLPNVVIEALACGCTIVATDAPGGTAEILDHGRHGYLAPVGDPKAIAAALLAALAAPLDPGAQRGRAQAYAPEVAIARYAALMAEVARGGAQATPAHAAPAEAAAREVAPAATTPPASSR